MLPAYVAESLIRHNAACTAQTRIRLRMALHAGEVQPDGTGPRAPPSIRSFRLIEAPPLKAALRQSSGVVALIVSDWFYNEVVRHHEAAVPSRFRQVRVAVKETEMTAWIRVLGAGDVSGQRETGPAMPVPLPQLVTAGPSLPASSPGVRYSLPPDTAAFTGREGHLDRITATVTQVYGAGGVVAVDRNRHASQKHPGGTCRSPVAA